MIIIIVCPHDDDENYNYYDVEDDETYLRLYIRNRENSLSRPSEYSE